MKHILLIDPLEKLAVKKDSSLLFAHSLKEVGNEVFLLFENNLLFENISQKNLNVYKFNSSLKENSFYLEEFNLEDQMNVILNEDVVIHMRLDPPFDSRYLQYLWLLNTLKSSGAKIINDPNGILLNNEKILAYELKNSIPTYIGRDEKQFLEFVEQIQSDHLIFKPVDLYQGIGVEKVSVDANLAKRFNDKVKELGSTVVVQPFIKQVEEGEIRSSFFMGEHMGSILKVPPKGEFLANIAQGAQFYKEELDSELLKECTSVCQNLRKQGIEWVAFDILGGKISEVNITCPGLVVEVSEAMQENIALKMSKMLLD